MPVNITLVVMAQTSDHVAQDPRGKYQLGDIVDVVPTPQAPEDPAPNSKFVFIDVTAVPSLAFERVKRLSSQDDDYKEGRRGGVGGRTVWYVDFSVLNPARRQQLRDTRRTSGTFSQARTAIKKRENEALVNKVDIS